MSETKEMLEVTKLSVNGLCGKKGRGRICAILGKATGLKTGEDASGKVWTALVGTFQGTNLVTGETQRSGKLFLPGGIQESVESAVKQLPEGGVVKFAMEFRRVDAENPIGYSYQVANLMPLESQNDELGDILQLVSPKLKLLEAPKEEEKTATAGSGKKK